MKQKVVIRLSVHDEKSRSKAMKTAVGVDGVDSASLPLDKDQIEVTGNDVDVVLLTRLLRKSVKRADVVSVSPVKEEEKKKEEKKEEPKFEQIIVGWPQTYPVDPYQWYDQPSPGCSIM
ncbi:putative heavy metal-associated domain, HMA [Rosa chinensis]|uniref:Putative heavy metal-associated domain, HMA n=1 Tax=Rosa chinensis TaxID=74649 RepID=A0A2P6S193_ROSCH|nr:heavy metal-associated isoprenylated plant protein 39 [Rosa chinensis]PRQ52435.1 putative heavy metal-associated domain, HMA [Rosa chinensis]